MGRRIAPVNHVQRTLLFIGLWVDEDPAGGLPPRFAQFPALVASAGLTLTVVHRRELVAEPWLAAPPAGIMLSGSRLNLGEDCALSDFPAVTTLLDRLPQVPVLGLCFGHQFLAYHAGGRLERGDTYRKDNDWPVRHNHAHPAFAGLPDPCPFAENHGQRVAHPGRDYRIIATSADGIEAIMHERLPRLGTQFHPEYFPQQATPHGRIFLENWLRLLSAHR